MTNLLFVSYSSKISSNRVNVTLPYVWLLTTSVSSIVSSYLQPQNCVENLFKPRQLYLQPQNSVLISSVSSTTSKLCRKSLQTTSALPATSKQCFETCG
ncbi:hypothetical protein [Streptococcus pneumoniae]|uniref:hypothetical protein n=1 Tax=Streptococcus pneumoniae TaxID=1313 RepID=UPI000B765243|nr:hypothetical protein [Streptococcus pneumoniae]SND88859.1 Uncharacterised protein [Streptococcus pneumoniae]